MSTISYFFEPVTWFTAGIGLLIGSFLNVCIFRIPEQSFFKHIRSVCRHCNTPVPAGLNIPVLSYLLLRGRTKCCQKPLSIQYPIVEFLTGFIFAFCYWKFPFLLNYADQVPEIDRANLLRYLHAVIFSSLLLICSVIDFRLMIIPDVISIPMIIATPLVVYLHPDLGWQSAAWGVVVGGLSLYVVAWLYWLVRREVGLGFGDVKFLAAIGGWLGVQSILPTVFLASISGSVIGLGIMLWYRTASLKLAIPFGPFLALGAWLYLFTNIHPWLF